MSTTQTTTKKTKSSQTKTKSTNSKKKEESQSDELQQLQQENNLLKESLVAKELEIKKKEEEIKDLEFEHQMYIEEITKENDNKIKELSAKLALAEHQKNIYFQNLEKMGVNPLNIMEVDANSDEIYAKDKKSIQETRNRLINAIQNKNLKFGNQIQILDNINSQFTTKNKENFF